MTHKFALSLSFEGIRLLWQDGETWKRVGEVGLTVDSLIGELAALRGKALAYDPDKLHAKLIIPNDQIKYLVLDIDAASENQIRGALDGATPYALDELAYDWISQDGKTYVAAVAKDTLAEAEGFAVEHRFDGVCFVASAPKADFPKEVFFGPCAGAAALGIDVAALKRADHPVVENGIAQPPVAKELQEKPAEPEQVAPAVAPEDPDLPVVSDEPSEPETQGADEPQPNVITGAAPSSDPQPAENVTGGPEEVPQKTPTPAATQTDLETTEKAAPVVLPSLGGASRNLPVENAPTAAPAVPEPTLTAATDAALPDESELSEDDAKALAAGLTVKKDESSAVLAPPNNPTGMFLSRRRSGLKKDTPKKVKTHRPSPQDERARMTIFGARGQKKPAVGGKPRFLGLILTVILLVFLAGVAAWASLFTEDGLAGLFSSSDDGSDVALIAPAVLPSDALATGSQTAQDPDAMTLASLSAPIAEELEDAISEQVPPEAPSLDLNFEDASRMYAATGIWVFPPTAPDLPLPDDLDTLYVASVDPDVRSSDAVALPRVQSSFTDFALSTQANPAPAGTEFKRDARGLIVARADGALSPNGFTVFLGRPSPVPPLRAPVGTPDVVALADERLAGFRPRPRPDSLIEQNERSQLGGLSRSELAAIRPQARSLNIQVAVAAAAAAKAAETAAQEAADEKAALEAAAIAAAEAAANANPVASATQFAVAASVKPSTRPRNFDRTVKQARANAEKAATAVAAVAPRTVSPSGNTPTTVARAATQDDVINLRRINLIGISGTTSGRKALVRLKNGRYVTVRKGDSLDGGRVASISETAVRYTKNGRSIVLEIGGA